MKTLMLAAVCLIALGGPALAQTAAPAAPPVTDPHAGHRMAPPPPASSPAPAAEPAMDHDMSDMPIADDPHAGHDMSAMGTPEAETPPPAGASSGPAHAADGYFDPAAIAASRQLLLAENGDVRASAVIIDRLEAGFGQGADTYLWDAQGWIGGDINRFWWKTEGSGDFGGRFHDIEVEALYSRAIHPFWDLQTGVRQTWRPDGGDRTDLVLGVQGLAPYWFEVDAAAFLSNRGELTARVEAEYDLRITQRLILQPRFEVDLSAEDIPELGIGSGISSIETGLRLRYEIRKEFAPYVGVEWARSLGQTADFARAEGDDVNDVRFVVGLKAWF